MLNGPEFTVVDRAGDLVRDVGRNTPYHRLEAAKEMYRASARQALALGSVASEQATGRALAALREALTIAQTQAVLWDAWVDERIGVCPEPLVAYQRFNEDTTITTTRRLLSDASVELVVDADSELGRLRSRDTGVTQPVSALFGAISRPVVTLTAQVTAHIKPFIDEACLTLNRLAAEVLEGEAVLMDPIAGRDPSKLAFNRLDRRDVQAAQGFVRQAQVVFGRIASTPAPPADESAQAVGPDGDTAGASGENTNTNTNADAAAASSTGDVSTPEPALPEPDIDLRRVVDSIFDSVDGLASEWSRRFPVDEYETWVRQEKEVVSSVAATHLNRLNAENEAAQSEGVDTRLDRYPPDPRAFAGWRSKSDPKRRWENESIASLMALENLIDTIQGLSRPSRLTIRDQVVEQIEFDPAAIVLVHEAGRLLADIAAETSASLAAISGRKADAPSMPEMLKGEWQQVGTAAAFSMAEALLLHAVRLARMTEHHISFDSNVVAMIKAAETELGHLVAGDTVSRGVVFGLATALTRTLLPHVEQILYRGDGHSEP